MSKSTFCVAIVILLGIFGVVSAQNVGSAQHYPPAIGQSYVALHQHYPAPGQMGVKPCLPKTRCNSTKKCQPGPQACCADKPCSKKPQACCADKPCSKKAQPCCSDKPCPKKPQAFCADKPCSKKPQACCADKPYPKKPQACCPKCAEKMAQCSKSGSACQSKVEPFECRFPQALKRVEAMHGLAHEAEKKGLGDVAHHLHVRAETMERNSHQQREHLQGMHQAHAELNQAAKCRMQEAQDLQRRARHLAEQIELAEQQMHKPRDRQ